MVRWLAWIGLLPLVSTAAPAPADWVPVRWPWADAKSLELLAGSPVNCLLIKDVSADFVAAANDRKLVTLALIPAGADALAAAKKVIDAKVSGIVLEGEFPEGAAAKVREVAGDAPVIELTARNRMRLGSKAAVLGTYQGVWPGVSTELSGTHKSGPTGSVWIDTNTGFIRAALAWGDATVWIANQPPSGAVVTGARYLHAIADAAISGARWVVAFDPDFAARLRKGEADALSDWRRMGSLIGYFEKHPEWRGMRAWGKLALVQDPAKGGLLSGGILDMIAVKHTPVRPVARQQLTAESLKDASMTVNVDADSLTADQKEILRAFARGGGTLLTGPPGWRDQANSGSITLDKAELERLNDIWRDVNSMVGRRNLGVRLFNVTSMLSNLIAGPDGQPVVLHLVNYSDYPVENVAVHFLGTFKRAVLITPEGIEKKLEIYETEGGGGVDLEKVGVVATVRLEQ